MRRDPNNPLALFNLALAHEHAGRYDEALNWVEKGLAAEPRELSLQNLKFRLRVMKTLQGVRRSLRRMLFWKKTHCAE
jgi:tetratricopeptide (TPR) repeat protein